MDKYWQVNFPEELIKNILDFNSDQNLSDGTITEKSDSGLITRNSQVSWIKDKQICRNVFGEILNQVVNCNSHISRVHLNDIEPIQYSEYSDGQEYGWHKDTHPSPYPDGLIRKLSFSVFLNEDYEGGEFDLEIYGPATEPRYVEIKKQPKTNCVIFHSDMWHRVRPVTKGVRKSLVGWVLGNQFK